VQVSLCVLASSCVKIPEFRGGGGNGDGGLGDGGDARGDGGGDGSLVSVVPDGDGAIVTAPGYVMKFSQDGAHFPYQLNLGGTEMIMGGSEQCADEFGMGIAMYPLLRVNGVNNPAYGATTLSIPLEGPYVGQVRLQWAADFSCPDSSGATVGTLNGTSTFSFFPDGRIARFDRVHNTATQEHDPHDCDACAGGGRPNSVYVTSYTTLIVDSNATLTDGTQGTLATYGQQVSPQLSTCMRERGHSVAFSWVDGATRMRVAAAPPTSASRTIAFVKDLPNSPANPLTTIFPGAEWVSTTQMAISTDTCGMLEPRLAEFSSDDHQLVINGNPTGAALTDGIYGGTPQVNGYPVDFPVTLSAAPTIAPRIPAGFAVWLYSSPIPPTLTLTHSAGHTGTWYHEQRVGQDSVVLWFNVPIEQGESITITGT
jgi:hypothetical protein